MNLKKGAFTVEIQSKRSHYSSKEIKAISNTYMQIGECKTQQNPSSCDGAKQSLVQMTTLKS